MQASPPERFRLAAFVLVGRPERGGVGCKGAQPNLAQPGPVLFAQLLYANHAQILPQPPSVNPSVASTNGT